MNILLVDDDAYVLEALMQKMDWEGCGIANVYTAYNVKRAKKIIEDIPIHVVVCDIEMPKEKGFALLSWIREHRLVIQFIFLTSYAEFDYAKKAIELQSFSYVLKPIAYDELAAEIRRAVSAEEADLKKTNYEKIFTYWNDTQKHRRENFWGRLCVLAELEKRQEIWEEVTDMELGFGRSDLFVPLVFNLMDYAQILKELGRGMLEWTFKNMAEDIFLTESSSLQGVAAIAPMQWLVMAQVRDGFDPDAEASIYSCARTFIEKIRQYFKCEVSCIAGKMCGIEQMRETFSDLMQISANNALPVNEVYIARMTDNDVSEYAPPDFVTWEELFNDGREDVLNAELSSYIKSLSAHGRCSKKVLSLFVMDCIQMLSSELKQRGIFLHAVGDGDSFETSTLNRVIQSPEKADRYLKSLIHACMESIRGSKENMSVVDLVKEHIDRNLDKEITRESLAELVYLNPDYLARVFKKEVGESLGNYLVHRRIEKAREYLEKTNDPVNTVAVRVGYDNFSYFSKVFKDIVGVTPKEYRKGM